MTSAGGSSRFLAWIQCNSSGAIASPSSCPLPYGYDRIKEGETLGIKGTSGFSDLESGVHQRFQQQQRLLADSRTGLLLEKGMVDKLNLNVNITAHQKLVDAKALAASKSHSEAERRRRERINNHLATLRSLLPSTTKTDKASLLAEVIEHVKHLKRQASEIQEINVLPTETDEINVDPVDSSAAGEDGKTLIRASVCCEDRPELMSDIMKSLSPLGLRTVKAEITTMGGRIKYILLVEAAQDSKNQATVSLPSLSSIHDALKSVLENPCNTITSTDSATPAAKRQRLNNFASKSQTQQIPSFVYA